MAIHTPRNPSRSPCAPTRRHLLAGAGAAAFAGLGGLPGAAFAQAADGFPSRPLRIVVPYPPGAINDVLARALADKLGRSLQQSVVVDNRPGGNTLIGTQSVASAAPDGYTLLQVPAAHAINAALLPKLPYDPVKSFEFITLVARAPFLLLVNKDLPAHSVRELVAAAKQKPRGYTFASSGNGGNAHLMGELLNSVAGIEMLHVPYKGTAQAINDLIGGQVHTTFSTYSGASAALKAGRVRALAVTSATRAAAFPDIPTIAEAGYPTYDALGWWGFAAPAGTPRAVVERLNQEINKAAQAPDLREKLSGDAVETQGTTPEEFRMHLEKEIALWRKLIKQAHIQPE